MDSLTDLAICNTDVQQYVRNLVSMWDNQIELNYMMPYIQREMSQKQDY
jgi:hypothetical protein